MNKNIILIILLALTTVGFGQKELCSFELEGLSRRVKKDSYSFINEKNNDLAVFVSEGQKLHAYLHNSEFVLKSLIVLKNMPSKFSQILGCQILESGIYQILYATNNKKKFAVYTVDFANQKNEITELETKHVFKEELFLDTVKFDNKLYVLSLTKSSDVAFKLLTTKGLVSVKTINLEVNHKKNRLYMPPLGVFNALIKINEIKSIEKIDFNVPNSIEQVSVPNKLYQFKNRIDMSFENIDNGTLVYTINLKNYEVSSKHYPYAKGIVKDLKKFNSFLLKDQIFQIGASKEELVLKIKNRKDSVLESYYINKNKNIKFKNSAIVQEGTATFFLSKRELEKTQKYLRKVSSGNVGVAVLDYNNQYYVTVGGFEAYSNLNSLQAYSVGSNVYFSNYNPTFNSYTYSQTTKSTYFTSKLDYAFNHSKGRVDKTVFEKIKAYNSKFNHFTGENVFSHGGKIIYGYVNQKDLVYNLVVF